jgi:hypothetical protein
VKGHGRVKINEIMLYEVKDGQIISEQILLLRDISIQGRIVIGVAEFWLSASCQDIFVSLIDQ